MEETLEVGTPVALELRLHQLQLAGGPLRLQGRVRWIREADGRSTLGIQFDEPDPTLEKLFQREDDPDQPPEGR